MVELTRAQKQNVTVGEYIAKFKDRTVLVLGAYDEAGIKRLDSIASSLTAIGYSPLLIRDIPDHPHQDLGQKVSAVGAIARFILIDDTEKSGHLMEAQICKQNAWVTVVLRAMGHRSSWMTAAFSASSKVLFEYEYDPSHPEPSVAHVCEWAEETLRALERTFTSTYPWRQGG
jgi:hypothetical protein